MVADVSEQEAQLRDEGSDYGKAVIDFVTAVTHPSPKTERPLTLKQFQDLRSDIRELSVAEIAEEKRRLLQEMQQLRAAALEIRFQPES